MAQKKVMTLPFMTLPSLEQTLAPYQEEKELEWDEIWSFVKRRRNKRWIWLALCRCTRQVVAFAIGSRGKKSCLQLWKAIPAAYKQAHCFADIWEAYSKVIASHQLIQSESKANTNHVERLNCTLRQRLGRLVRETFFFPKPTGCIKSPSLSSYMTTTIQNSPPELPPAHLPRAITVLNDDSVGQNIILPSRTVD